MKVDARAEAWARLQVTGLAPRPLVDLLRAFGTPEAVLAAKPARAPHRRSRRRPRDCSTAGPDPQRLETTLAWLAEPGNALVAWDDADYPRALLETADPPPVFYCIGRRDLLSKPGARDRRQPQRDAAGKRRRRSVRGRAVRRRAHHRQRARARASTRPRTAAACAAPAAASPSSAPVRIVSTRRQIALSRTSSPRAA